MCGIAGMLPPDASGHDVDLMLSAIEHRGPDECGTYVDNDAAIGTARLSIVDIAGGHQPMRDEATGVVTRFNGEIFNFIRVRESLIKGGVRLRTHSDTEVVLAL